MRIIVLLTLISFTSASIKELVDNIFDKYLPPKASWEEVKACQKNCSKDEGCLESCPKFQCPFQRISKQCQNFNSSLVDARSCHHACGHDFSCHIGCPMAKPTTISELQLLGDAMLCHTQCGHDHQCHKACHRTTNPWGEKQIQCEKLHAVVMCMHNGGSHTTCPQLDEKTKMQLMQEPWSLIKDIGNHIADYLVPMPKGQDVSVEVVKTCHMQCKSDISCHKNCPKGVFGRFHDKCDVLEKASECHQSCEHSEVKCPFKKMKCHLKCPMSMPSSVKELKGLIDHVLCHSECGKDKTCHTNCPNSNWGEKKAQCNQYDEMVACHKRCGGMHACHASCPHLDGKLLNEVKQTSSNVLKDMLNVLVV
jgi:hypothetical protein